VKLCHSRKRFFDIKADAPFGTITRIEEGFKKIGLFIDYSGTKKNATEPIYSGCAFLRGTHVISTGKGITPRLSQASAYGELVERISEGIYFNYNPFRLILEKEDQVVKRLGTSSALYERVMNYGFMKGYLKTESLDNLETRVSEKEILARLKFSPPDAELIRESDLLGHWVDAYSLLEQEYKKVPIKLIKRISGTTGLAAGNSMEEAIAQASCEIFERYALLYHIKKGRRAPRIEKRTIESPHIRHIDNTLLRNGITTEILDFSATGRFPVVGIVFTNENIKQDSNILKRDLYSKRIRVASSFNLEEAILRCFAEELQGISLDEYRHRQLPDVLWKHWVSILKKDYIKPNEAKRTLLSKYNFYEDVSILEDKNGKRGLDDIGYKRTDDFLADIEEIRRICVREGWKLYVIDATNERLEFPVARVIIPGVSDVLDYYFEAPELKDVFDDNSFIGNLYFKNIRKYVVGWKPGGGFIKDYIADVEEYLSKYLIDYSVDLRNYGLRRVCLFASLAKAKGFLGQHRQAAAYKSLLTEIGEDLGAGQTKYDEDNGPTAQRGLDNPFINSCQCEFCRRDYPERLQGMLEALYG
jgi:ribosomal protein S12 methylthiotransferase accessory factor